MPKIYSPDKGLFLFRWEPGTYGFNQWTSDQDEAQNLKPRQVENFRRHFPGMEIEVHGVNSSTDTVTE